MNDDVQTNLERSRRLYEEIFGKGNYAAADDLMAAGIVNHGPGSPPVLGTDGIKRQAALLRTAIPDLRTTLNDQFGHDDRVVSRWTGSGTHSGPLTLPAGTMVGTGRSISFEEIRIDRHARGRVVESWWIPDRFTLWQQLGLLPAPPERPADSADPGHATAAGKSRATSPVAYAGEAGLPAVTDEMLRYALQGVRRYTVCILKAGPGFQEPGPARESWVADLIWEHGKRNYALYLAGLMRIICPVGDGSGTTGVSIFDADPGEADRIMRQDPAVKAGLFTYELHATQTFPESTLTSASPPHEVSRG
jgi:predicted ester cyclase